MPKNKEKVIFKKVVAVMLSVAVFALSGCTSRQKETDDSSSMENTSQITAETASSQMLQETEPQITEAQTTEIQTTETQITETQTTETQTTETQTTETQTTEVQTTVPQATEPQTVPIPQEEGEQGSGDKSLNFLQRELDNELSKKAFPKEAQALFRDTLDRLYVNYPTWQKCYRDLPDRDTYIRERLIRTVGEIKAVEVYLIGTKQADELLDSGEALGWTEIDENEELIIGMIIKPRDKATEDERNSDIEYFFHEVTHCHDFEAMYHYEHYSEDEEIAQLIIEGSSTFHMKFTMPFTEELHGAWLVANGDETLVAAYKKENCAGYLTNLSAYEKLTYLAGYDAMNKLSRGKIGYGDIKSIVADRYGEKAALEFFEEMKEWFILYEEDWKGDKVYELSIDLENRYMDFLEQDINALRGAEAVKSYKEIFRFYKTEILPTIEKSTKNGTKDITEKTFPKLKELDTLLERKGKSAGD